MDKRIVNIATQPHRVHALEKTIGYLLPQCDKINVYLNNFTEVPEFLIHEKINAVMGDDLGATGKFYSLGNEKGYYLVADDDLIYGSDHVNYICHMIDLYKRQAVVGVHATMYARHPIQSYYTDKGRVIYYAIKGNSQDRFVHMLGTGTLGFHTDTLPKLRLKHFPEKRMCDPYFAKYCIEKNVPQVSLTRASNWIKLQSSDSDKGAIWKDVAKDDTKQTAVINSIKDFKLVTCEKVDRNLSDASLDEKAIIEIFKTLKSGTILELGSGAGTRQLSKFYNMVSIEHDKKFLNKHKSRYIHAPLKDGFYDLDNITIPEYDLLIVDGVPAHIGKRSKLLNHLEKFDLSKPILVDDVHRQDELNLTIELAVLTGRDAKIIETKTKKFAIL